MIVPENPGDQPKEVPSQNLSRQGRVRWWIHLIVIGSYPLLAGIMSFGRSQRGPALTHDAAGLLRVCAYQAGFFAVLFGVGWLASHANKSDLLLAWRPRIWAVPLGIAYSVGLRVGLAIVAIFAVILLLVTRVIRPENLQQMSPFNHPDVGALVDIRALRQDPAYFWLNVTLVSLVVAGLREELWRAAFLAGLRRLWPGWFGTRPGEIGAIGVAAAVFGFGHVAQGPVGVAGAGLLGLGLGTIMVLHRSIWPAVVAHGFFDATTFALLALMADRMPQF